MSQIRSFKLYLRSIGKSKRKRAFLKKKSKSTNSRTGATTRDIGTVVKCMVLGFSDGQVERTLQDSSITTGKKVKDKSSTAKGTNTQVIGKITKEMEKVCSSGQMGQSMMETLKMTKCMVKEPTTGRTVHNT